MKTIKAPTGFSLECDFGLHQVDEVVEIDGSEVCLEHAKILKQIETKDTLRVVGVALSVIAGIIFFVWIW